MTHPAPAARDDGGFTLIEVLITIMVISIGVVGLIFGLMTAASGSSAGQKYADTREVLAAAAERVQAADYQPDSATLANGDCDPNQVTAQNAYTAAISGVVPAQNTDGSNAGTRPVVAQVAFWNGSTFLTASQTYANPDTTSTLTPVHGCYFDSQTTGVSHMQRITLQLGNTEKLTIVKRQP